MLRQNFEVIWELRPIEGYWNVLIRTLLEKHTAQRINRGLQRCDDCLHVSLIKGPVVFNRLAVFDKAVVRGRQRGIDRS